MVFRRFDRFTRRRWKGPDKMFVIGLALNVGKSGRFRPEDAVVDRQPCEHGPITDAIERSPPETAQRFGRWIVDLPDDLRCLQPLLRAFAGAAKNASRSKAVVFRLHLGDASDLTSATSGLRHQSSRRMNGTDTA